MTGELLDLLTSGGVIASVAMSGAALTLQWRAQRREARRRVNPFYFLKADGDLGVGAPGHVQELFGKHAQLPETFFGEGLAWAKPCQALDPIHEDIGVPGGLDVGGADVSDEADSQPEQDGAIRSLADQHLVEGVAQLQDATLGLRQPGFEGGDPFVLSAIHAPKLGRVPKDGQS